MSLPTNPGTYIAIAKQWAVEQKPGKCPQWVCEFQLGSVWNGTEWEGVAGDESITGYFTIINTDGAFNKINCEAILNAYTDLPSLDFSALTSFAFGSAEVKLEIGWHEHNGKKNLRVAYLNHISYEGRQIKSDPAIVQSLQAKYGGAMKMQFKRASVAKPVTPPPNAKASAWAEFKTKTPTLTDEQRKAAWIETVQAYSNGKNAADPSVNWQEVGNAIAEYGPFKKAEAVTSGGPGIPEDDIPFAPNYI